MRKVITLGARLHRHAVRALLRPQLFHIYLVLHDIRITVISTNYRQIGKQCRLDQTAPKSDQGIHCLPLHLHLLPYGLASLFEF